MNQNMRKRILNTLTDEWQSTTLLSKQARIHYYKMELLLPELEKEGLVEKDEKTYSTFWRLKHDSKKT